MIIYYFQFVLYFVVVVIYFQKNIQVDMYLAVAILYYVSDVYKTVNESQVHVSLKCFFH